MNTAYSVSRHEILEWVNNLLSTKLTKIEQLGSGNIYCHILDAAYPEKVPLSKVKWNAYLEVDFLHNFKILTTSFQKLGIDKYIQTQKLVKAKYQDNLEFIQWMKWHLTPLVSAKQPYDALKRRNNSEIHLLFTDKKPQVSKDLKQSAKQKENKENIPTIASTKSSSNLLKSYKSAQQLKKIPIKEQELRKAFEIGQSLKALIQQKEKQCPIISEFKKGKKNKIEVTLRSHLPLQEKNPNIKRHIEFDEECF